MGNMNIAIYVIVGIAFLVLIAYVITKMDDALQPEKNRVKGANITIESQRLEILDLKERIKAYVLECQKKDHKLGQMQIDYDRLLTNYHELEKENCK